MLLMLKQKWTALSNLGVLPDMPIPEQKGLMLYNRLTSMLILMVVVTSGIMYFAMEMRIIPPAFLLSVPLLLFLLVLNKNGNAHRSVYIFAIYFPVFFTITSVVSKLYGEGDSIIYVIAAKFGILISSLFPLLFFGIKNKTKILYTTLPSLMIYASFDALHSIFAINLGTLPYRSSDYIYITVGVIIIFLLALVIITFLQSVNSVYEIQILQKNKTIEDAHILAIQQRDRISTAQQSLTDSIRYARRIQTAVLPSDSFFESNFQSYFILNLPRDIVSGDFYFVEKTSNKLYLAVADCTGHGVPGALMSMLGSTFLHQIISKNETEKLMFRAVIERISQSFQNPFRKSDELTAGEILTVLRELIKKSLNQNDPNLERKEGMDMVLCVIDFETKTMQFSGAHNSALLVSGNNSILLKGDKMPIGISRKEEPFSTQTTHFQTNDMLFLYTDGFQDQFGGEKNLKFKSNNFVELLKNISQLQSEEQYEALESAHTQWKANFEQTDDILVLAVKFK